MNTYAFVFARGGSKGLPGKNLKLLGGKPLLQYSIDTAHQCDAIAEVFVSTDDDEIARIARNCEATVIERPSELASDNAPEWLAWQHAIEWVLTHRGSFERFVSLPPTSPLRSVEDVESALAKLSTADLDICISVTPASRNPFFNMIHFVDDRVRLVCDPGTAVVRRQDAPDVYDITTVVYASTPSFILTHNKLFDGKVGAVIVPKERAVDIDDIVDFQLAEVILQNSLSEQ